MALSEGRNTVFTYPSLLRVHYFRYLNWNNHEQDGSITFRACKNVYISIYVLRYAPTHTYSTKTTHTQSLTHRTHSLFPVTWIQITEGVE